MMTILSTARLRLEPFAERHAEGLNRMNADPDVTRYIGDGATETLEQTRAVIARVEAAWRRRGYSWWTVIDRGTEEIVGAATLQHLDRDDVQPHEVGWRLRRESWGQGFATEAAKSVVAFAFDVIGAPNVYAVAHPDNLASHRVMERLGMRLVGIEQHYEQPCVTYRLNPHDDYG